jgi:hypothetical protein
MTALSRKRWTLDITMTFGRYANSRPPIGNDRLRIEILAHGPTFLRGVNTSGASESH